MAQLLNWHLIKLNEVLLAYANPSQLFILCDCLRTVSRALLWVFMFNWPIRKPIGPLSQSDYEIKTRLCEPVDFIEVFDATDKCDPLSESGIIDSIGPVVDPSRPLIPCLYIRQNFQFVKPDLVL